MMMTRLVINHEKLDGDWNHGCHMMSWKLKMPPNLNQPDRIARTGFKISLQQPPDRTLDTNKVTQLDEALWGGGMRGVTSTSNRKSGNQSWHRPIQLSISLIWRFPKLRNPQSSSILMGFSIANHPAIGYPRWWKPSYKRNMHWYPRWMETRRFWGKRQRRREPPVVRCHRPWLFFVDVGHVSHSDAPTSS